MKMASGYSLLIFFSIVAIVVETVVLIVHMVLNMKIEPGQYIWRTNNTDFPVTVIESLGKGPDGRSYVKIVGSTTAIPADELVKIATEQASRRPKPKRLF